MTKLHAKDLILAYDDSLIIKNLDVKIPEGEITVLVGANGCGKSTLLRGISRLLRPKQGSVILDGQDIWKMPTKKLAQQLGILPQSPTAPEGLTVHELVSQGRYPHQSWLQQWSVEDDRVTREALEITDMTDFSDRAVDTLSGGQRQRAWIAMTLAQDSDLILLDEPTTYLDLAYQIDVLDLLHDLNINRKKTIVMVLHDLNHACRYADHLIALRNGRIVVEGDPSEVVTEEIVRDVFGIDCRIVPDPVTDTPLVVPLSRVKKKKRAPISNDAEPLFD